MIEKVLVEGKIIYRDDISKRLDEKYDISKIKSFCSKFSHMQTEEELGLFITVGQRAGHIVGMDSVTYDKIWDEEEPKDMLPRPGTELATLNYLGPIYVKAGYLRIEQSKNGVEIYFPTEDLVRIFLGEIGWYETETRKRRDKEVLAKLAKKSL